MKRAIAIAVLVFGGCTWFDGDPPTRTCKSDNDCFRAQGERCDQTAHVCEAGVDAAADVDATVQVTP